MATILDFPPTSDAPRSRAQARPGQSAEIVIFPGVRYERWPETVSGRAAAAPKATTRDFLKIVD